MSCKHEWRIVVPVENHSTGCEVYECKSECLHCGHHSSSDKPNVAKMVDIAPEPKFVPPIINHNEIDSEWGQHKTINTDKPSGGVMGSVVTKGGARRNIAGFDQATPAEQRLLIHAKDLYDAATEVCGYVENRVHSVKPIKKLFQALDKIDGKTYGIKMFDYIK